MGFGFVGSGGTYVGGLFAGKRPVRTGACAGFRVGSTTGDGKRPAGIGGRVGRLTGFCVGVIVGLLVGTAGAGVGFIVGGGGTGGSGAN